MTQISAPRSACCLTGLPVVAFTLMLSLFTAGAQALEFQCSVPNDTRYLKVEIPGKEHLCEVSVTYLESGDRKVKWYAQNDTMFCSARAYQLRNKYEGDWNYSCTTWPDSDGIDRLSPRQRQILDLRLKAHRAKGTVSDPPVIITSVRAVASTPLDRQPGKLALQFFAAGGDFTEVIDDQVDQWNVDASIPEMATHIVSELPVDSALLHAISDQGDIEIHTSLANEQNERCYGTQVLTSVSGNSILQASTPHRFVCYGELEPLDTLSERN